MEHYTVTFVLETPRTVEVEVSAQTEDEALAKALPRAEDAAKHMRTPLRVGRVLRVEKTTP